MLGVEIKQCGGPVGIGFGYEELAISIVVQLWATIPLVKFSGAP